MNFELGMRLTTVSIALVASLLFTLEVSAAEPVEQVKDFLSDRCFDCHDATTQEGDLRLDDLSTREMTAATSKTWALILRRIESGEMPPQGEERPEAKELQTVIDWAKHALAAEVARRRGTGQSRSRRLNRLEYENTIHDLLGVKTRLRKRLPGESYIDGFNTSAEGLRISSIHIQKYLQSADLALQDAITRGPRPASSVTRMHYQRETERRFFGQKGKGRMMVLKDGELQFYCDPGVEQPAYLEQLSRITNRQPGRYKIRIAARTLDPRGERITFGIRTASKQQRLGIETVAWFDAPANDHAVFETEIYFAAGETIIIEPYRLNMMRRNRGFSQYAPGDSVLIRDRVNQPDELPDPQGLALGIAWVEAEGPLTDRWPPLGHQRLFADLPLVPFKELSKDVVTPGPLAKLRHSSQLTPISDSPLRDARRLLTDFLPRAFRRPVSAGEIDAYVALAAQRIARKECFESAMLSAYRAALCSPDFLFIAGSDGRLDDYALATRLSYMLWRTAPDETLIKLAGEERLSDPAVLRSQTERLLSSPRSQAFVIDFVDQWLSLRNIDATQPDKHLYPEFFIHDGPTQFRADGLLVQSMLDETRLFFSDLVRNDGSVQQFIDSDFTYLNHRLAEFYQLPPIKGSQLQRVLLPDDSVRGGVLTQASVLKVTANGTRTSPVVRGVWILENILGRTPSPPPPDAGSIDPDTRGTTTIREQLAKHQNNQSCASCHKQIDPPGFALESFDPAGQWREVYRTLDGADEIKTRRPQPAAAPGEVLRGRDLLGRMTFLSGQPVDCSGQLADGSPFSNVREFKSLVLQEPAVIATTLATKMITFAVGRPPEPGDRLALEEITKRAQSNQYGLRSLIHAVIQSPLFQAY